MTSDTRTPAPAAASADDALAHLGPRALRAREAILDSARKLFLERGYAGTRINNITDDCGASRAGFYTYFKDKKEIVEVLGRDAYHDCLTVVSEWDSMPRPASFDDVQNWVADYMRFMDKHGAFMNALAESGPTDDDFRATAQRLVMRTAFLLGASLRSRQPDPTHAPEALGLSVVSMIERTWTQIHARALPISSEDAIESIAQLIWHLLNGSTTVE